MAAQHARAKGVRLITCVTNQGLVCALCKVRKHVRLHSLGVGSQDPALPKHQPWVGRSSA